jgi:two-component system, OmpR family, phosphate regulon sensor histidine kinase PhoR
MTSQRIAPIDKPKISSLSSAELLQRVIDTSRECVIVVGTDTRISTSNEAAKSAFGRGFALDGRRLSEVIRDLGLHQAFKKALEEREPSDLKLELISNERRKFDVHVSPINLDERHAVIGFFHDTTQIERLEHTRQEFLSNISHELRTPLTSIMAFVETLEDGAINDEENNRRFLDIIRRNAERMHNLIDDILELSLIESGNVSVQFREVKLSPLVDEVFASLSSKAAAREITTTNEVPADTIVRADSIRLEQMITNLVDNAIKFNRRGGTVTVSFGRRDSLDTVAVVDTGEGLTTEQMGRIFERFYRADRARSQEIPGTGLGLAIVKHLAKLHGGEVTVSSELTRGTTFQIELPTV